MLGSGRPFLVEIQNARHVPSEVSVKEMEKKINNLESNLVSYFKTGHKIGLLFLSHAIFLCTEHILHLG